MLPQGLTFIKNTIKDQNFLVLFNFAHFSFDSIFSIVP